ncbi:MAG: rhomboid family intramembrane serine protease [Planctomycetes bacterium]|nr:rhomboid family intramembrane serine protease [Planctomycetota bacterium]
MGVYDRDYYRVDSTRQSLLGGTAPACKLLIALNIGVYLLQMVTLNSPGGGVTGWFLLSPEDVLQRFQIWRLLTSAFCHSPRDIWHIIFNMMALWWFGAPLEALYGSREFFKFYLTAAILSAVGFLGVELLLQQFVVHRIPSELGASGAVMAVLMLCALHYPTTKVYIMFVIPLELRWLVGLYVIYDLYPILRELGGAQVVDNVAHATHLAGLVYGFLYKKFDLRYSRWLSHWSWPQVQRKARAVSRQRQVKLYTPPQESPGGEELSRQVDEILAKISAQGESSLTEAEREILKEASRRYKNR